MRGIQEAVGERQNATKPSTSSTVDDLGTPGARSIHMQRIVVLRNQIRIERGALRNRASNCDHADVDAIWLQALVESESKPAQSCLSGDQ